MPPANTLLKNFGFVLALSVVMNACQETSRDSSATVTKQALEAIEKPATSAREAAAAEWRAANRGIEAASVGTLAVDAFLPGIAYAGTADGLYRTATAGLHWQRVSNVPGGGALRLVSDPSRFGVAYAGAGLDGHLYETNNAGLTWTPNRAFDALARGPGQSPYAQPLAVAETDSNVLYAVVDGVRQLFLGKTVDGGNTWTVGPAPGDRGSCCLAMLVPTADHAYLSTLTAAPSLYETKDGGATWTRLTLALSFIQTLASDPRDPKTLYAVGLASDASGPIGTVLRKSTDAGATWFAPSAELSNRTVDSVAVSKVDGRVYVTVSADEQPTTVLVSRDGGVTFEIAASGLETHAVAAVVPMPALPCGAYAATRDAGVFKTHTSGGACR